MNISPVGCMCTERCNFALLFRSALLYIRGSVCTLIKCEMQRTDSGFAPANFYITRVHSCMQTLQRVLGDVTITSNPRKTVAACGVCCHENPRLHCVQQRKLLQYCRCSEEVIISHIENALQFEESCLLQSKHYCK